MIHLYVTCDEDGCKMRVDMPTQECAVGDEPDPVGFDGDWLDGRAIDGHYRLPDGWYQGWGHYCPAHAADKTTRVIKRDDGGAPLVAGGWVNPR